MNTIAIIGTAGRQDDAAKLTKDAYDVMYGAALDVIAEWSCPAAVSGGAAWADHLAVRAFLEGRVQKLTLHLPATLTTTGFANDPDARTANFYHAAFSKKTGLDSFGELIEAVKRGAQVVVSRGFKARNFHIGMDATHLVAFTFGPDIGSIIADHPRGSEGFLIPQSAYVKNGGTSGCWRGARNPLVKRHVNLTKLIRGPVLTSPIDETEPHEFSDIRVH